jgi:hypothetical protein
MVIRIIALIAISSIISLMSTMHGHTYANLILGENEINSNQIQRYYPIASLINNQTTNKEIMTELKSQIENSDPFKMKGLDNERNINNLSSTDVIYSNDVNSKDKEVNSDDVNSHDADSNDVKPIDNNECKSDCHENSKHIRDDIPFELPSIPFP